MHSVKWTLFCRPELLQFLFVPCSVAMDSDGLNSGTGFNDETDDEFEMESAEENSCEVVSLF